MIRKTNRIVTVFLVVCLMISCQWNGRSSTGSGTKNEPADTITSGEKIVEATITNKDGITLNLKFDNKAQTCLLQLNGDTVLLKQERMASGIRYSNKDYTYSEWHGEIRLYKDSTLIFSHFSQDSQK